MSTFQEDEECQHSHRFWKYCRKKQKDVETQKEDSQRLFSRSRRSKRKENNVEKNEVKERHHRIRRWKNKNEKPAYDASYTKTIKSKDVSGKPRYLRKKSVREIDFTPDIPSTNNNVNSYRKRNFTLSQNTVNNEEDLRKMEKLSITDNTLDDNLGRFESFKGGFLTEYNNNFTGGVSSSNDPTQEAKSYYTRGSSNAYRKLIRKEQPGLRECEKSFTFGICASEGSAISIDSTPDNDIDSQMNDARYARSKPTLLDSMGIGSGNETIRRTDNINRNCSRGYTLDSFFKVCGGEEYRSKTVPNNYSSSIRKESLNANEKEITIERPNCSSSDLCEANNQSHRIFSRLSSSVSQLFGQTSQNNILETERDPGEANGGIAHKENMNNDLDTVWMNNFSTPAKNIMKKKEVESPYGTAEGFFI